MNCFYCHSFIISQPIYYKCFNCNTSFFFYEDLSIHLISMEYSLNNKIYKLHISNPDDKEFLLTDQFNSLGVFYRPNITPAIFKLILPTILTFL